MKHLILLTFFLASSALADPRLALEGVLTDGEGALLEGPVALTFAVYDQAEGAAPLWTETHREVEAADVTGQHIHPGAISIGNRQIIDGQGNWTGPAGPAGGGATDCRYRFTD